MSRTWGQARIEIDSLRGEIARELEHARPVKSIYDEMKAEGRVSVTYKAFRVALNRGSKSSEKTSPASWGIARTEVIALRSQIRAGLAGGRTLKSIYEEFKAEGRISGTYQAFHVNVKKFCFPPKPGASPERPVLPSAHAEKPSQTKPSPGSSTATSPASSNSPEAPPRSPSAPAPRQSSADTPGGSVNPLMDKVRGKERAFVFNRHRSRKEIEHGPG